MLCPNWGFRRAISLEHVPTAILSRQTAGIYKTSVIVNLPGSPSSIQQILPRVRHPTHSFGPFPRSSHPCSPLPLAHARPHAVPCSTPRA